MLQLYSQFKRLIPARLKYPLWFVFKAPQRQIGWHTLWHDLQGLAIFMLRSLITPAPLYPVTICTGLYNRSDNYLRLVESLRNARHKDLITLSVFDCGSDDKADLEQRIRCSWNGTLIFHQETVPFSRSHSFNRAIDAAPDGILLICDADLSLPNDLVLLCNRYAAPGRIWYPIYFFLYPTEEHVHAKPGFWDDFGSRGLLSCAKEDFWRIGGFDEGYKTWGGEDNDLWRRFHLQRYIVIRNRQPGFFHHWHYTHNPKHRHLNREVKDHRSTRRISESA